VTEDTGRAILKWALAILLLAGVSLYAIQNIPQAFRQGIAFGDDAASESPSPELALNGPVTDGEALPTIDFALVGSAVSALAADGMVVGPGPEDGIVLSFPRIPGTAQCVQSAVLEMTVRQGSPPTDFGVYPSALTGLEALAEASPVTDPYIPISQPVVMTAAGTPGPLTWDVLTLYQTYAGGGTFDNGVAAPAIGAPFTIVVKPTDQGLAGRTFLFASTESPDSRPRLVWTGVPGCAG
jgi:hypothetical protein